MTPTIIFHEEPDGGLLAVTTHGRDGAKRVHILELHLQRWGDTTWVWWAGEAGEMVRVRVGEA